MIEFREFECKDLPSAKKREWIIANGIGGYSSSTTAGLNTRRYHGLLVAATKPPLGRFVLLSQLEDTLLVDGIRFDLSTNVYMESVVHPMGHLNLTGFRLDPFPIFTYSHDNWKLEKSIFMVRGENTTVIEYVFSDSRVDRQVSLEVRPLLAFRDYHGTTHENRALNKTVDRLPGYVRLSPYANLPALYLAHDPATVQIDGYWYKNFEYEEERARGLDCVEDLYSPLIFKAAIAAGGRFTLIASTSVD